MWRLIRYLFVLALVAGVLFIGFAYIGPIFMPGDFDPPARAVTEPVVLGQ